ncbi:SCA7, zinc-binding domain-containing protein [Ilyonectria robusta]|uniref:SCA7, zinc-binding domain-containing protein n=1 Tax=Ilyonectria robusta TaxID=1079257 RepID=UPI001E8DFD31|nr:SCA7, zinc-binding domain-containing protein [Ilyonectria robusta]KAH8669316.1 SCA7, zinc-binding domain-containing protein [Ilyonectria robusta]
MFASAARAPPAATSVRLRHSPLYLSTKPYRNLPTPACSHQLIPYHHYKPYPRSPHLPFRRYPLAPSGDAPDTMGSDAHARKDEEQTIKGASKKDSKNGTIKLKKPPPKHSKPVNWRDGSVIEEDKKKNGSSPSASVASPGPVVNQLNDNARETFATGRPLEDSLDLQQCKHCKSILKTAAKSHIAQCLRLKKEKAQRKKEAREVRERAKEAAREEEAWKADEENGEGKGDDDSDGDDDISADKKPTGSKTAKKAAGKKPDDDKKGKKRKADGDPDEGPKAKKKKDEPKAKRQCGVILPNGQPCARSLMCKNHSMGAKRAVAGRSLPYDMLRAAYQKKNQAKQQSKSRTRCKCPNPIEDEDDANNGPVDSDEETAAVIGALAEWNPQPLIPQPLFTPIKRQYQLARLHEQLQMATDGGRTNIFRVSVVGFGGPRRSSFGLPGPSQRQPSVTSRG